MGEKTLGAAPGGDEHRPGAGTVVLQGNEQHYDTEVFRRIPGLSFCSHAPLAANLERDIRSRAVSDVGEGYDCDLAVRLVAHLGGHPLHMRDGGRIEHASEIDAASVARSEEHTSEL